MAKNSLDAIYHSALKFLVPLKPEKTFATVIDEAIKLVDGKDGSIFLPLDGTITRVYTTNKRLYQVIPRMNGFTVQTFFTGKPNLRHRETLEEAHPAFKRIAIGSDITIALSYEGKSIGVMSILSKKNRRFTKNDLMILRLFAPLATLAIRKAQLYAKEKEALETRDLFISMASHELKTPLTTIHLYAQLLQSKIAKGQMPEKKWADTLSWEVLRLTLLVNELLRIDQIKTGQLQYNWKMCSLRQIIQRAVNDFIHAHPAHPVFFNDEAQNQTDAVYADYDKLLQVIFNLLNNAAKFSPLHEAVTITLKRVDHQIALVVMDKGKGIDKNDLPNIFDRFYKGKDHTKEGMGLGLFLTKKIVDEHNGTIAIDSWVGKGTVVTVMLPQIRQARTIAH